MINKISFSFIVKKISLFILPLFFFHSSNAQQGMPGAPRGAFVDYFENFPDVVSTIPNGDIVSSAIVGMRSIGPNFFPIDPLGSKSTGFFIRTFRNDDKICMCMSGKMAASFQGLGLTALVNRNFVFDGYLNYLGQATITVPTLNNITSVSRVPFLAEIVAMKYDRAAIGGSDIALVLIDKARIPMGTYGLLGYDFTLNADTTSLFYIVSHPLGAPQKFSGFYKFNPNVPIVSNFFFLRNSTIYTSYTALGSEGAPILKIGQGNLDSSVVGSYVTSLTETQIPPDLVSQTDGSRTFYYRPGAVGTLMSVIRNEIIANCWQNKTVQELTTSGEYKHSVQTANAPRYNDFSRPIAFTTDFSYNPFVDAGYVRDHPGSVLLKGSVISFACNITPTAATNEIYVLGSQQIELNPGFSYTATGTNLLALDPVLLGASSSSSFTRNIEILPEHVLDTIDIDNRSRNYSVYPSPSTGIININTANNDQSYLVSIFNMAGELVFKDDVAKAGKRQLNVTTKTPSGMYILQLKTKEGKKIKIWKIIISK